MSEAMNSKTLEALRRSISHWEKNEFLPVKVSKLRLIASGRAELASTSGDKCDLCKLFARRDCVGCPVNDATGMMCAGTPYIRASQLLSEAIASPNAANISEWRKAAREQREFLQTLLPKDCTNE